MTKRGLNEEELCDMLYCDEDTEIELEIPESESDSDDERADGPEKPDDRDFEDDVENSEEEEIDHIGDVENWEKWKGKEKLQGFPLTQDTGFHPPRNADLNKEIDFFQLFCTDSLLQAIVDETNRYITIIALFICMLLVIATYFRYAES